MGHKKQEYLKCFATVIQTDTAMFAKDPPVQKMDPTDLQLKGMGWGLGMASALPSEAAAPTKNQIEDEMHKLGWAKPPVPPDVNVAWMAKKKLRISITCASCAQHESLHHEVFFHVYLLRLDQEHLQVHLPMK